MASFVAVVVGCFFFFLGGGGEGRGCYVLFKKGFAWFLFFVCLFVCLFVLSPFLMENL